ncbi:gamma-glutamylcyclotransferase family protein [Pseudoalteromonas rubra]|uniref:Gamma-glutamylcyclotransferase AIG2-like domain-containing protein n=1 Tax=Pseudoalteromonas rubra TaxID=43658 RepID=A0A0F4QRC9_9GAMM|nr:gamma-glutamylcyclotransferase family protein [Pseudoalteromonas rubra]KJZ10233.1 hypothetical protein TW77_08420 [Pseudoalteromonas rubra]
MAHLFVYGTLAPGRVNAHILAELTGKWQSATVKGQLQNEGWGAKLGYPGLILDEHPGEVTGLVFTSDDLDAHWQRLDDFEGAHYTRVLTNAQLEGGQFIEVYVYTLAR